LAPSLLGYPELGIEVTSVERGADPDRQGSSPRFDWVKGLDTSWQIGGYPEAGTPRSQRRLECPSSSESWSSLWQSTGRQQTYKTFQNWVQNQNKSAKNKIRRTSHELKHFCPTLSLIVTRDERLFECDKKQVLLIRYIKKNLVHFSSWDYSGHILSQSGNELVSSWVRGMRGHH
jgi:hypothetical protein